MAVSLTIPGIPIPKGRPRFTRSGFTYTPEKTRKYEKMVADIARKNMSGKPPLDCPIKVLAVAYMPIPRMSARKTADAVAGYILPAKKPDIDNLAKAALDACNGIVWRDDALICSLLVKKRYAVNPRLEIKIVSEEKLLFGEISHEMQKTADR